MYEAHIAGIGIAVPPPMTTERFIEVDGRVRELHGHSPEVCSLAARFARNTGIVKRHSVHPAFTGQPWEDAPDIFSDEDFDPPLWRRLAFFKKYAPRLALQAARTALRNWGGDVSQISHVITTATSGWSEPGLACALIEGLGLGLDTQKCELNFNGCFCGATCLRLARDTVRAGESGAVLVVALELALTHYEPVNSEITTLVANGLFADGAAAVVLDRKGPWKFERAGMSLVPGTKEFLTFAPPAEDERQTYAMFLHRDVGKRLAYYFREQDGQYLLNRLLDAADSPPALAVHPGGPNILEALGGVLTERGWPEDALAGSFETLHNYGNLGSAAMLFVLANNLRSVQQCALATFAFGPGVTVEWGTYRRVAP